MRHPTLLLIAVISRIGSGLAASLTVLYVTQFAGLHLRTVGITLTIATAIAVSASIWIGHLSDRLGARDMYIGMFALQAIATGALVQVRSVPAYAIVVLALAVADLGARSSQGAVIHAVVPSADRLAVRATVRVAANLGFAVGAALGSLVLTVGTPQAFRAGLLTTAALIFCTGLLIFRLPRVPAATSGASASWAVLRDRPFVLFMGLNGVLNIHNTMLTVALPLWIATRTNAPHWMVSVILVVNAATVVLCQLRLTRGTDALPGAARAARRSGLLLALSCLILATTSATSTPVTITLLILAALAHVTGEILESASGWSTSYALAPPGLIGQYQGAHAMGRGTGNLLGPTLFTAIALPLGPTGWLLTATLFTAAGLLTPVILRRAQPAVPEHETATS
ncbi:MFS transporter [Kribbella solani]|uniref:MFS transporter n=1 Tax=Kribbella solani TaxID=236067 RepID=UPI0029BD39F8|nr:MFS transporter [Kribbella solani]MDX3000304.1 MFS transporter [Kribbella solani]